MKRVGMVLAALALVGACPGLAGEVDQRKPYGRVCISVVDASGNEDPIDTFRPGAGNRSATIVAHVEANRPCVVAVAALDENGGALAGWTPQVADLQEWDEVVLPKPPLSAKPTVNSPFEFHVVFLAPQAPVTNEVKKLVSLMQKSGTSRTLAKLQADKFRELISGALADSDRTHFLATHARTEIAGTIRSLSSEWRKFASEVNFSEERPGLLILPCGKSR